MRTIIWKMRFASSYSETGTGVNWEKGTEFFKVSYRVSEHGELLLRCQDRKPLALLAEEWCWASLTSAASSASSNSLHLDASMVLGLTKFRPSKWVHPDWSWRGFPGRGTPKHPQGASMTSFQGDGVVRLWGGCSHWLRVFASLLEITGRV